MSRPILITSLTPTHSQIVIDTIRTVFPLPTIKVYLFGSRARGTHRPYSDIDILLDSPHQLPGHQIEQLRGLFEDSHLPFFVDVVDRSTLDPQVLHVAQQHLIPLEIHNQERTS